MVTFHDLRVWLTGDAIDPSPASDADLAEYHYLSEWQGATVTFRNPARFLIVGTVIEVDADDDAIWLFVEYRAFGGNGRMDTRQTWLTTNEVTFISSAKQTAMTAEAITAAHS